MSSKLWAGHPTFHRIHLMLLRNNPSHQPACSTGGPRQSLPQGPQPPSSGCSVSQRSRKTNGYRSPPLPPFPSLGTRRQKRQLKTPTVEQNKWYSATRTGVRGDETGKRKPEHLIHRTLRRIFLLFSNESGPTAWGEGALVAGGTKKKLTKKQNKPNQNKNPLNLHSSQPQS